MKTFLILSLALVALVSCGSDERQVNDHSTDTAVTDTLSGSLNASEEQLDELSQELSDLLLQLD